MKHFLPGALTRFVIIALCSFSWSACVLADDLAKYPIAIPAQNLAGALQELSKQSRTNLIYRPEQVRNFRTRGLVGTFSARQAAEKLIEGTPLVVSVDATGALLIAAPLPAAASAQASPVADARKEGKSSSSTGFRLAQVAQAAVTSPTVKSASQRSVGEESSALQEIIVTAQKYSQRAFDVPISLDVISGATLLQHGVTDLSNLQYEVPGLYVDDTGFTQAVYLRGVANSLGNGSMVGTYVDDADLTTEAFAGEEGYDSGDNGLYDLNRVEVLKGPQGTLYGDGSMGGVIRYITNEPVLDRFETSADVAALFTEYGAPSQRIETMINTPLVTGTLGFRIAGILEHDGGWVDEPAASLKNVNDSNLTDVRAEALWEPTAQLTVNAMEIVHRHSYVTGGGEDSSGNITPPFQSTLIPNIEDNSNLSNLTATYDINGARLMSSSTYFTEDEPMHSTFGQETVGGATYGSTTPYQINADQDFSEELRLVHAGTGPWQWTVGGFYKHFRDSGLFGGEYFGVEASSLASVPFYPGYSYGDSSTSLAGFANTSVTLFDRLTLGAGARYFKDRETTTTSPPPPPLEAATFTSTDPRFYVQYRVSSHVNTYASASKGFRSGGFNDPPAPPYQPEVLWSYDLGSKIRYPTEGLQADVDLFYMNYTNFVTEVLIPTAPFYVDTNSGAARIKGVDADLTWQPVDGWRLGVNTEILSTAFLTATSISPYAVGDRLPFAPKYSFTASVDRGFRWEERAGDIELYYYEISRVQYRAPLSQSDVLRFLSARTALHWNDDLTLDFFGQNILNDRGEQSPFYPYDQSVRPRPRTFGIEADMQFE